jgi:RND superfamily putative drug exporter
MGSDGRPPWTLRHPRVVVGVAVLVLIVLGGIGFGVEKRLEPTTLDIPGTPTSRANEMLRRHFGDSAPFAILLRGPAAALDRQGPELIRALRRDPRVNTLSPWDRGAVGRLRPSPREAIIAADFHVDISTAVDESVPALERTLEEEIHAPVRATQTGFATLSRAIQDQSLSSSEHSELLALPFLLLVLLLVFRSPVAAAIPLGFGVFTVIASRGVLYFFTDWFSIDAFALAVCSMMGLALGVDYALLMVSRFREELAAGKDPIDAARETRHTAGRTTIFAGSTLLLSMLVSIFVVPGPLLASLAGTVAMVVVLSVAAATLVGPALLVMIGPNIDRWRIGPAPNGSSRLMVLVNAALKRPAAVAALIGAVVLVLAAPAVALKTGPPSAVQLPEGAPAREDAELIARTVGPGFEAPYQLVVASDDGPITDAKSLAAINRWQHRLAQVRGVQFVIGPGQVAKPVKPLQDLGNAILSSEGNVGPVKQLGRLGRNLAVAAGGVGQLRSGLAEASDGAGLLAQGSDRAAEGAELLAGGLGRATSGSQRAAEALKAFASGTRRLSNALRRATLGMLQLKLGLREQAPTIRHNGLRRSRRLQKDLEAESATTMPKLISPAQVSEEQLKAALAQLVGMTTGKADPNYAPALEAVRRALAASSGTDPVSGQPYAEGYAGLPVELGLLQTRLAADVEEAKQVTAWWESTLINMTRLTKGAEGLSDGINQIAAASNRLARGAARLARVAGTLEGGLGRLTGVATSLAAGLGRLTGGTEALQSNLASGSSGSAPLQAGLQRGSVQVLGGKARIKQRVRRIRRASPGLFNSGYFVLSAVDGASPRAQEAASTTIDLNGGGQAAMVRVTSRYSLNTPGSIALNKRLDREASEFADETGLTVAVAGGVAQLNEFSDVTSAKIPLIIAVITLVTFLVLVAVLRSIPLAAIAVGLNLATVAVAFGILTLLFEVPADLPLGGNTYVDAVSATMIFGIVFGLSIDYAVFLLSRMREHYDREGDNAAAIEFGLDKTARVITGAAAIMMAVFIAFASASIAGVSQLGIGLTVAVILDATVVRIVLLPALMLLIGDRVWWLPRPLARVLPKLNV